MNNRHVFHISSVCTAGGTNSQACVHLLARVSSLAIRGVNQQNEHKKFDLGPRRQNRKNKIPEGRKQIFNYREDPAAEYG